MIDLESNVFSLSESEELKKLLKNPDDDFQRVISLLEKKVFENTKQIIESEKKYRSLIKALTNIGFGIDIVSKDHKIMYQNQVLKENFGDCLGELCYEKYMGIENRCGFCQMEETLEFNKIVRNELKAADDRLYEIISAPYPNPDGTFDKVLEVIMDITDKKLVEQKLRESEEKFRTIAENSNLGISIAQENQIKYVNKQAAEMLGYTIEEMNNWNFADVIGSIHPDDVDNVAENMQKSLNNATDALEHLEYRVMKKSGNYIWVDSYGARIIYMGRTAQLITTIDITERIRAEEERKKTEIRFRSLIENTTDAVFCYEFSPSIPISLPIEEQIKRMYDCILVDCNLVCAKTYGRERVEDVIGRDFTELFGTTPKSLDTLFRDLIKGGYRIVEGVGIEKIPGAEDRYFLNNGYGIIENGKLHRMWGTFRDITERIKSEQRLKESEEKYRVLTEQSLMGICIIQEGKFKYINQAVSDINGYSIEEMLHWSGTDIAKIIYHEDLEEIAYNLKRSREGDIDERSRSIFRLVTKSGNLKTVEEYNKKITYEEEPASLVTLIDITSKVESDEKLKESEHKYRHLFYNLPIGISIFDSKGSLIESNKVILKRLSEYAELEFQGKSYLEIIPYFQNREQLLKLFTERMSKVRKGFNPGPVELYFVTNNGKKIWLYWNSTKIEINNEMFIQAIMQDITEQKEAEAKLRESEEKFRNISEQSLIGIGIVQDNKVKYVNKKFADIFGYTIEEMLSWSPEEFMITVHPDDREFVFNQVRKKQEGSEEYVENYQFRGLKKSGEIIWIENFTKTIMFEGKLADFVAFIDITEQKNAQQELIKLNQLKSELLRRTSHELKTPLVSIKGFSDLLLQVHRDKLDALVISTLNEIKQGCLRLETLIADILKTAELESGAIQLNKTEEDLSFLINVCVNEIKGFSTLRNHTITLDLKENLITHFEKEQIHQVISNLLTNAVKYTPPSGMIEIKSEINDDFIVLSITDNGIGFTEEEKTRIFKQFGKIERYGQGLDIIAEGSGFGLFISKKIIELHGGNIWVESEGRNKGSTFSFSLPII